MQWSSNYPEIKHCPADPFFTCVYFNDLVKEGCSISIIISALCGIRWGHINAGLDSPTDHPIVKLAFRGAKKLIGKTITNKKEPFTVEIIKKLVSTYGESKNLMILRFLILCIIGFAGFFRISELLAIKIQDIIDKKDFMEIYVAKSKTDQLREGHIVYVGSTNTSTCPVTWLRKYLSITGLKNEPSSFLICRLAKTKTGHNVLGQHGITYETARKTFLDHLQKVTNEPGKFGTHSLRSGGATAAANNNVSDRMIGKHGRWSANTSRDGYIKDSKSKRLSVSKSLGI